MFPIISANSAAASAGNDEGIFGFGYASGWVKSDITNLVSNAGVIASDVSGVGTSRAYLAACEYGEDKGIFGYGSAAGVSAVTNLVSNTGVVSSDQAAVTGTARWGLAACSYGGDKGIFGYAYSATPPTYGLNMTNLVSNTGVVSSDQAGVGTGRYTLAACEYGGDKGIFGFGRPTTAITNLVSNTGVVASDTAGVGTARKELAACCYGEDVKDKGMFAFGTLGDVPTHTRVTTTNLVSNTGVVASNGAGAGTARGGPAACEYGIDKAIFGFGWVGSMTSITNLVSNVGVVASDQAATTGTARANPGGCSFN